MSLLGSAALSVGVNAATGLLNKLFDSPFASAATKRSVEANKELMQFQQGLQQQSNLRAMSDKRHSLERAGLNLNAENGFQPVQAVPMSGISSPKVEGQGFDFGSLASIGQYKVSDAQAGVLEEEKRLKAAEAALAERKLRGEINADAIMTDGDMKARAFVDDDGLMNLEVVSNRGTKVNSVEGFQAMKDLTTWVKKEIPQMNADRAQSFLQRYVAEAGITDSNLIYKMAHLPAAQFDLFVQDKATQKALESCYWEQGRLYVAETELKKLEKTIQENSNLGAIWEDISSAFKSGDYLQALGGIVKALFMSAMNNYGFHFSFGRSSSTNTNTNTNRSTSTSTNHNYNTSRSTSTVTHKTK